MSNELGYTHFWAQVGATEVEDCLNSFPEPIARIPSWLKEASRERDIQAQEAGKYAGIMNKDCNTATNSDAGAVVPAKRCAEEGGCNLKSGRSGAPASRVQTQVSSSSFMARQYATELGTEHLKGWERVDQLKRLEGSDSASLELLKIKESLKRWKSEVDVGLERLEAVIKKLENGGLGLGFSGQLKSGLKGKEKMEAEGKGGRPVRSFKPKSSLGLKRKKPSPLVWRKRRTRVSSLLQVHDRSKCDGVAPAGSKTGVLDSVMPELCTPGMNEVADAMGPPRETGATPVRDVGATLGGKDSSVEAGEVGRVVSGDMGPFEDTKCPQIVSIGKYDGLGPLCETGAEPVSAVGVTEDAGSSLGGPSLANQSARLLQLQGEGTASSVEGFLQVVAWSLDELDQEKEKVSKGLGELGFPATESELPVVCSSIDICQGASGMVEAGTEVGNLVSHAPLNSYVPSSGGGSGYSDLVVQCANEIYPIVGISFVGHKLQLLALLTFLEGERRNNSMVANSGSGTKGDPPHPQHSHASLTIPGLGVDKWEIKCFNNNIWCNLLNAGNSDFLQNYYVDPLLQVTYSFDRFSDILMQSYTIFIQGLYALGGRRIGVTTLPPVGCLPAAMTIYELGGNECVERLNNDAIAFNNKLNATSQRLQNHLSGLILVVLDIYQPLLNLVTYKCKQMLPV
ncbi:hypothetical protein FH972_010907 [Carpinus fangiana]|uniref:Uncharacterized protein n=1 Tax=Carpinus fangiana TaxID=176857 RepID=A0A660KSN0_9ROSI|nr:hypothetical protein FH972_010907 [Carpinus fangiana]